MTQLSKIINYSSGLHAKECKPFVKFMIVPEGRHENYNQRGFQVIKQTIRKVFVEEQNAASSRIVGTITRVQQSFRLLFGDSTIITSLSLKMSVTIVVTK